MSILLVNICLSFCLLYTPFTSFCTPWLFLSPPSLRLSLSVNSWQGLLGELILLQEQLKQHEEEARRAAGNINTGTSQQKRKVMGHKALDASNTCLVNQL